MAFRKVKFEGSEDDVERQWLEARKKGIGGSDVAAIVGVSKYSSPLDMWLVKTGRAESPDLSAKQAVEWGTRLEPLVADKFSEMHPELAVEKPECMFVSEERPWAVASVDRVVWDEDGRDGILEIKTVGLRASKDWESGVPDYYMTQVVHYLAVTGFSYAWVAVLIGGQEYREYRIERDEEDVKAVSDAVDSFWNDYVIKDVMPGIVGSEDESRALSAMFSDRSDEMLVMLDDEVPQLDDIVRLKADKKKIDAEIKKAENEVKSIIGDAAGIETESRVVKWIRSTYSRLDTKALSAEMPDIVAKYSTEVKRDGGVRITDRKEA